MSFLSLEPIQRSLLDVFFGMASRYAKYLKDEVTLIFDRAKLFHGLFRFSRPAVALNDRSVLCLY